MAFLSCRDSDHLFVTSRRLLQSNSESTLPLVKMSVNDLPDVPLAYCQQSVIESAFSRREGASTTCCSAIDTAFGPRTNETSRNCLCLSPALAAAKESYSTSLDKVSFSHVVSSVELWKRATSVGQGVRLRVVRMCSRRIKPISNRQSKLQWTLHQFAFSIYLRTMIVGAGRSLNTFNYPKDPSEIDGGPPKGFQKEVQTCWIRQAGL